jgi:type IV secretion system protein VirB9
MYNKKKVLLFLLAVMFNSNLVYSSEPVTMDSRVKTYIYNPNEVFPVVLHYGYHTHIDLPKNEFVKNIMIGNPADWDIVNNNNKIFLQTYSKEAHTNMTLITNKRTYEFDLVARSDGADADYDLAYAIKFYYPEENSIVDTKQTEDISKMTLDIADLIKGNVNANYVYSGDSEVTPVIAFNDDKFTYLKFKDEKLIPKIKAIGYKKETVQIFSYNGYIIINNVFPRIELSNGKKVAFIVNKAVLK